MILGSWMLFAPIWLIGILLYLGMAFAAIAGWQFRSRSEKGEAPASGSGEGYIVSTVMGLLALLVGFTFALAIDRYDTRRAVVLSEANAIGTVYLRTQLLSEPHRARISALLRDYTANRLELARRSFGKAQQEQLAQSDALILELWNATIDVFPQIENAPFAASYLASVNEMIDIDSARQQSRRSHVPGEVFAVLVVYQIVASAVLGFVLGVRRGRVGALMLLLLFGGSLLLVIDIDRPNSGGIRENQGPMELTLAMIDANPPSHFGQPETFAAPQ